MHQRSAALDLLRGAAALAVALAHFCVGKSWATPITETLSVLAVEVFFVLSGFVLAPQIGQCLQSSDWRTLRTFLLRRLFRTVPPYYVALLTATFMYAAWKQPLFSQYVFYVQALVHGPATTEYFPVAWSLSVEEWAYATFAVLVAASWLLAKRSRSLLMVAVLVIGFCTIARLFAPLDDSWGADVRRVSLFRVDAIAYGVLLRLACDHKGLAERLRPLAWVALWVAATALGFAVAYGSGWTHSAWPRAVFPFTSAAFGAATVLMCVALEQRLSAGWVALSVHAGRISYSLYLFHSLFLAIVLTRFFYLGGATQLAFYLLLCVVFCFTFYDAFERPILAARPRYQTRAVG